ncbi:hypothetical protein B0H14DRAFT_3165058 [Mycena olivaceomarginata]|nr:hypothetical protein B0H14DRAFT_3165058 [Mycena olivaceomarginata]
MAPRNLPPLGPPPAHSLPPVPAFCAPLCRTCVGNWKSIVRLQDECRRLIGELQFTKIEKLYYEFLANTPDTQASDGVEILARDGDDEKHPTLTEQEDSLELHETMGECTDQASLDTSGQNSGENTHESKVDANYFTGSGVDEQDRVDLSTAVDSPNWPIDDARSLRTVKAYALFGPRANDFGILGFLVGQRMGRDIPVSILWKNDHGEAQDGSTFRLYLTAGAIIRAAIFRCSKSSLKDLVNIRPEHHDGAMVLAESFMARTQVVKGQQVYIKLGDERLRTREVERLQADSSAQHLANEPEKLKKASPRRSQRLKPQRAQHIQGRAGKEPSCATPDYETKVPVGSGVPETATQNGTSNAQPSIKHKVSGARTMKSHTHSHSVTATEQTVSPGPDSLGGPPNIPRPVVQSEKVVYFLFAYSRTLVHRPISDTRGPKRSQDLPLNRESHSLPKSPTEIE